MTTQHTIEIEICPDGKIKGEVVGVKGKECGPLSKWLDQIGTVIEDRKKPDYYQAVTQTVSQK